MVKNTQILFIVLLLLNIIVPILYAISVLVFNYILFNSKEEPSATVVNLNSALRIAVGLLQIVSGATLVYAVYLIRTFLKTEEQNSMNVKMLCLHSTAFGLYIISQLVY
jgi:hypothetical protein